MQVKKSPQEVEIRYVKGIGPRKAQVFNKVGVRKVSDLLYYLPRRYEDRSEILSIKDIVPGEDQAVVGLVEKASLFSARTGTRIYNVTFSDGARSLQCVWYNQPYLKGVFRKGMRVLLYGRVQKKGHFEMIHPAFEILNGEETGPRSLNIGRIVPVYPLTEGLNQRSLRKAVHQALRIYSSALQDVIPTSLRARHKLVDIKFAVENIHFPYSFDTLKRAYYRMVFEEFFLLQVVLALKRRRNLKKGISHRIEESYFTEFSSLFEFSFTSDQQKVLRRIEKDMASKRPMYRLLQGDVGSGKTVAAIYALYLSLKGGRQGVFMAPTEILARQHFHTISNVLMPLGYNVRLLLGGMNSAQKKLVTNEAASGEADIIIGTHALFQKGVEYKNLGAVVIDEQHKFGVEQRKRLMMKSDSADILVMTATPIPRSLALTVFGDMDVSALKQKPRGRQPVSTWVISPDQKRAVYEFIREQIQKGGQAFIVCPRIGDGPSSEMASAEKVFGYLSGEVFPEQSVALVHGRMEPEERKRVMDEFRSGKHQILIATTVIEVGVDIPNVTAMLIEDADRYGLAQLHQLRGRIGRGKKASYCMLVASSMTPSAEERLRSFTESEDGFQIAEKDMDLRGPGELLGSRQSGLPELKFGDLAADFEIMQKAREEAFQLVEGDPDLSSEQNRTIKKELRERFGKGKALSCGS